MDVTYKNGIAIVVTPARTTQVNVAATADLYIKGCSIRASKTDALALAVGYIAMAEENRHLASELAAARAGQIGKDSASAMQDARKAVANLRYAADVFMDIYDTGNAPDSAAEGALRNAIGEAEHWLVLDASAAGDRYKILGGK
jgi:hypothetical protein